MSLSLSLLPTELCWIEAALSIIVLKIQYYGRLFSDCKHTLLWLCILTTESRFTKCNLCPKVTEHASRLLKCYQLGYLCFCCATNLERSAYSRCVYICNCHSSIGYSENFYRPTIPTWHHAVTFWLLYAVTLW